MAKIEPKRFATESRNGHVKIADLALHQDIRSDRDGRSHQYLRVSGVATSDLEDFDTIIVDAEFEIYDGDERLGSLSQKELTIRSREEPASFDIRDALKVAVSATVTKITIATDVTVVSKSEGSIELVPEA